jgi:hypothetical protein
MARRRKPINFDLITSGNKDELRRVCDDLRLKRPCGPNQDLHAEDYTNYYDGAAHLSATIQESQGLRREGGGYTNYQLYTIAKAMNCTGTYVDDWDIRRALLNVYGHNMSQSASTRRTNRITERLRGGYRSAIQNGDVGDSVYGVYMRTERTKDRCRQDYQVQVVASSDQEAQTIASTLFGYALGEVQSTDFVKEGTASDTMTMNEKARQKTLSYIGTKRDEIAKLTNEINDLEAAGEAISMYSISAFSSNEDAGVDI